MKLNGQKLLVLIGMGSIFFMAIAFSTFQYVQSLINQKNLNTKISQKIQKVFPDTEVVIGNIHSRIGANISFEMETLDISLEMEGKKSKILELKNVSFQTSLWSFLIGEGKVRITIDSPRIFYIHNSETSNIGRLFRNLNPDGLRVTDEDAFIFSFLSESKVDLKILNLDVFHKEMNDLFKDVLGNDEWKHFILEKLIVKDFFVDGPMAYEVDSKINYNFNEMEHSFQALIVGEVNLRDAIKNKKFHSSAVFKAWNMNQKVISFERINLLVQDFIANLDITFGQGDEQIIKANVVVSNRNKLQSTIKITPGWGIELEDVIMELYPEDLLVNSEMVRWGNKDTKIKAQGRIGLRPKIAMNLKYELNPGIRIIENKMEFLLSGSGVLTHNSVNYDFQMKTFEGMIGLSGQGQFHLDLFKEQTLSFTSHKIDMNISDVDFDLKKLIALGHTFRLLTATDDLEGEPKNDKRLHPLPVFSSSTFDLKVQILRSKYFSLPLQGHFILSKNANELELDEAFLEIKDGTIEPVFKCSLVNYSIVDKCQIQAYLKKVDTNVAKEFFDMKHWNLGAQLNLEVKGDISWPDGIFHHSTFVKGELEKGFVGFKELTELTDLYDDKIEGFKKSFLDTNQNLSFDHMKFDFQSTDEFIKFKLLSFINFQSLNEGSLKGNLYLDDKKRSLLMANLKMNFSDNDQNDKIQENNLPSKKIKPLKKSVLHIRLHGPGIEVTPDLSYTIEKMKTEIGEGKVSAPQGQSIPNSASGIIEQKNKVQNTIKKLLD